MRGLDPRIHLSKDSIFLLMDCRVEPAMTDLVPQAMSARLFLSSGDLVADRRYEFARDLQLRGDLAAAADLLDQAIELAPHFVSAWFVLGKLRKELGQREAAIKAFRRARDADPQDHHGASLHLMQLGVERLSDMPKAYVQALFDQYAPRFDEELLHDLGYRGPSLLFKAVLSARAAAEKPAFFKRAIDLGCGTGLGAAAFAKHVDRFIGIDLSAGMIERARATGLYAELEVDDMLNGLRAKDDASADFILAADAMVYVRDLAAVLTEVGRVLARGGMVAFTVETHDGEGVVIGEGLRYAHAAPHIRSMIDTAGLRLSALQAASTRNEGRIPVPGLVVVATKA
jgi:predicted TPR repeat methyltransferase